MNRRILLLSASAAVIAAVLPAQVFATSQMEFDPAFPVNTVTAIEDAINAAQKLGFSSARQMAQFGFETNAFTRYSTYDVRAALFDAVAERYDVRVWNNLRCVLTIHEQIVQNFPQHDPAGVAKYVLLDGAYVLRDEMATGIEGLRRVAMDLGADFKMHTIKDLRAFG